MRHYLACRWSLLAAFAFLLQAADARAADPFDSDPTLPVAPSVEKGEKRPVVSSVAVSPNGLLLATGGDDHIVRLWNTEDGGLKSLLRGHLDWVRSVTFSPDGTQLASAGDDRLVRIWDTATGRDVRTSKALPMGIYQIAYSPDGQTIAAVGFGDKLHLLSAATLAIQKTLDCSCPDMRSLTFSPDGSQLAAGGRDGRIRIWNLGDGSVAHDFSAHRQRLRTLCFSPDGGTLASAGEDRQVHLWQLPAGGEPRPEATLDCGGAKVMSLVFCGPARLATGGSDNVVRLWDAATGREISQLNGHTGTISTLAVDAAGELLVSGSFDTTIRLWTVSQYLNQDETAVQPFDRPIRR